MLLSNCFPHDRTALLDCSSENERSKQRTPSNCRQEGGGGPVVSRQFNIESCHSYVRTVPGTSPLDSFTTGKITECTASSIHQRADACADVMSPYGSACGSAVQHW